MTAASSIEERLRDTFDAIADATQLDVPASVAPNRGGRSTRPFVVGLATVIAAAVIVFALVQGNKTSGTNHPAHTPTAPAGPPPGRMPYGEAAQCRPGGDWTKIPIGILVITDDRGGVNEGFVPRGIQCGAPSDEPAPVYARDMKTLVGHMYVGRGFIPEGADPNSIPCLPATSIISRIDGTPGQFFVLCDPPGSTGPPVSATSRPTREPPATTDLVEIPAFVGKTVTEANALATQFGVKVQAQGVFTNNRKVRAQNPVAGGDKVPRGTVITIFF